MALRCVVMIEKWRAPSIIRKAMSRQLWSTTASETLQPSSFALATPAASILRLAASVSRWVGTKSGMRLHVLGLLLLNLSRLAGRPDHHEFARQHLPNRPASLDLRCVAAERALVSDAGGVNRAGVVIGLQERHRAALAGPFKHRRDGPPAPERVRLMGRAAERAARIDERGDERDRQTVRISV